jgi:hypothetical protein
VEVITKTFVLGHVIVYFETTEYMVYTCGYPAEKDRTSMVHWHCFAGVEAITIAFAFGRAAVYYSCFFFFFFFFEMELA